MQGTGRAALPKKLGCKLYNGLCICVEQDCARLVLADTGCGYMRIANYKCVSDQQSRDLFV